MRRVAGVGLATLSLSLLPAVHADAVIAPTVSGAVLSPNGEPVADADVKVEALTEQVVSGAPIDYIAETITDASGRFSLDVPVTDELRAAALANGGTLNISLLVSALETAEDAVRDVEEALREPTVPPQPSKLPAVDPTATAAPTPTVSVSKLPAVDPTQSVPPTPTVSASPPGVEVGGYRDLPIAVAAPSKLPAMEPTQGVEPSATPSPVATVGPAPQVVRVATYYLSLLMLDTDNGDEAMIFSPKNGLVLFLGDKTTEQGLGEDADPVPSQQPEPTDHRQLADTMTGFEAGDPEGDGAIVTPIVSPPLSEPDPPGTSAYTAVPDVAPPPQQAPPSENEAYDPVEVCRQPENWETTVTHVLDKKNGWTAIGELHTTQDMTATFTYSETADTDIGIGVKHEGKGWKVGGAAEIRNDADVSGGLPAGERWARHVMGQFLYYYERHTVCGYGCCSEGSPKPRVYYRIRAVKWTGAVAYSGVDLSEWDGYTYFKKAAKDGRAASLPSGSWMERTKGKGFTYRVEATAFGVTLGATTDYSTKTRYRWEAGKKFRWYHMFGSNDVPADAKIVYAYH